MGLPKSVMVRLNESAAAEKIPYRADGIVTFPNTFKGPAPRDSAASFSRVSTAERVVIRMSKAYGKQ